MSYVPELLILQLSSALGLPPQQLVLNLLTLTELAAEILVIAGLLLFVQKAGRSTNAVLLTLLAILDSPIFFNDWLDGGRLAEIVGAVGFAWSLVFLEMFRERDNPRYLYLAAIAVFWASTCHFVTGAATIGTVVIWSMMTFDREKIGRVFRGAVIPGILLAAFWIVPFSSWLAINSRGIVPQVNLAIVNFSTILGLDMQRYDGSVVVLLLVPVLIVLLAGSGSASGRSRRGAAVILFFALLCYLFFVGPLFGLTYPGGLSVQIFLKWAMIFSACFIGLAYSHVSKALAANRRRILTVALAAMLLAWLPISFFVVSAPPVAANGDIVTHLLLPQASRYPDFASQQFRFGSDTDTTGAPFNYYFPASMQTRGYSNQFVVNPDWQFYLENNFWRNGSALRSRSIADWFAMKHFVSRNDAQEQIFRTNPYFNEVASYRDLTGQTWTLFTYPDASPIVSATNASRILIIGQPNAYDTAFRALAFAGIDSTNAVTIRGPDSVTSQSDVAGFNTIFLYGYTYDTTDRASMWEILKNFVAEGGRLVVDTGFSPDSGSDSMPDPLPVSRTIATDGGRTWHLQATADPITSGIDFSSFSPAVYQGAPWGISSALNSSVRQGSRVLVWLGNNPAVVARHFGNGLAIWMGFNLPYHAVTYQNPVESLLLSRLLSSSDASGKPRFQVTRPNMDTIETAISTPALGLLVKEFHFDEPAVGMESSDLDCQRRDRR